MWECKNCKIKVDIDLKYPIRCYCGLLDYGNSQEMHEPLMSEIETQLPKEPESIATVWANLHTHQYTTPQAAIEFFANWQLTIPDFGCPCREHWAGIVREYPPDFSHAKAFFLWGVDAHNKVNDKLGKPIFSHEEAFNLYKPSCV